MESAGERVEVLVIGAGIAGLMAARALRVAGLRVTILDKGRGFGGRMATRRADGATFDHGAPCLAMTHPDVVRALEGSRQRGALRSWDVGGPSRGGSGSGWRGHPGMSGLARDLAAGLDVRLETEVSRVGRLDAGWLVTTRTGEVLGARALILTAPVPQSLALLGNGGVALDPAMEDRLRVVEYARSLAVMAVLDGPSRMPAHGNIVPGDGPVARITENGLKGVSAIPAVTIHGSHAFSVEH